MGFSIWNYLKQVFILNGMNLFFMLVFSCLEMTKMTGKFCRRSNVGNIFAFILKDSSTISQDLLTYALGPESGHHI